MSASVLASLRTDQGLIVGQALEVRKDQLVLEMPAQLQAGLEHEFRLELPGADETVRGHLQIRSITGARIQASILNIAAEDRECFESWWSSVSEGRASYRPRVALEGTGGPSGMHGASRAETELALARIEERKQRFAARLAAIEAKEKQEEGELFVRDLFQESRVEDARAAPPPPAAPPPLLRPPPVPSRPIEPAPPPAQAPVSAPSAPTPAASGPLVSVLAEGPEAIVDVRWFDPTSFMQSLVTGLASGFLELPLSAAPRWPGHPTVHLCSHRGTQVEARAQLLTQSAGKALYRLELAPVDQGRLQADAM